MQVVLKQGEELIVRFTDVEDQEVQEEDSEISLDGSLIITFGDKGITVSTDWPDTKGRVGELYNEQFGDEQPKQAISP